MKLNKDKMFLLAIIALIVLGVGIGTRLLVLEKGFDTVTANWSMFGVIVFFILAYLLFMDTFTPFFAKFIDKVLKKDADTEPMVEEETAYPNEPDAPSEVISRPEKKPTVIDLKLESFAKHSKQIMADYISPEDHARLIEYVGYYARGEKLPEIKTIATQIVDTYDLCHYGWNMWNHFKVTKQPEVAEWLKEIFVELDDIDISTIEHNLKHRQRGRNYKIQLQDKIE